jgi:NADH-quinone oxidoreductase subunit N
MTGPQVVPIDWGLLGPVLTLLVAASALLVAAGLGARRVAGPCALALAGVGAALGSVLALWDAGPHVAAFGNMLVMDRAALYMSAIVLMAAFLCALYSWQYLHRAPAPAAEYYALLLLAALGMVIMASTDNLLVMFLGLEVLSVSLYVLAGITRDWLRSLEAALKYFLLGAFSTGFILYGMAFLYGATGSLDLTVIGSEAREIAATGGDGPVLMLLIGLGLVLVGLAFKVAAVPFHWWAPDVYEGAPTPITGFMAVGTKAVAFLFLLRLVTVAFGGVLVARWTMILAVLALLSMVVGNLVALVQRNIKRLLAYSSVAHAGYLLVAVAAGSDLGTSALMFYFAVYLLTTLGAFGVASLVAETTDGGDEGYGLLRYAGLGSSHPVLAAAMSVFMLSLIGIPPTGGFVGKYFIFQAAIQRALEGNTVFLVLAVAGLLTSVVSAAYYLRVMVYMYMQEPDGAPALVRTGPGSGLALLVSTSGILILGIHPDLVYGLVKNIHRALQTLAMAGIF